MASPDKTPLEDALESLEELRREWPGMMSEHVGAEFRRVEAEVVRLREALRRIAQADDSPDARWSAAIAKKALGG